jgi:hypothetical protein
VLSSAFAGGLAAYLVYGPGSAERAPSTVGFQLSMAGQYPSPWRRFWELMSAPVGFGAMILQIVRALNDLEGET